MADTEISGSSATNPVSGVPVMLSIKFLEGEEEGDIYYHYFFAPPPVWIMSEHGYDTFAIVDSPLLPAEDQQEKEYFLDIDIKEILSIVEESLMIYYGHDAANLGLGSPDVWAAFVTEHDAVEIVSGTTLRKLINTFLESDPIAGSPLIISLINGFDDMYSLPEHSISWFDHYPGAVDDEWEISTEGENQPDQERGNNARILRPRGHSEPR